MAVEFPLDGYVTDKAVADFCNVKPATVWNWAKGGKLPKPVKLSEKCTRWKAQEVRKYLEEVAN